MQDILIVCFDKLQYISMLDFYDWAFEVIVKLQLLKAVFNNKQTAVYMDKAKDKPIDYGEHKYWDERYLKATERFEWLTDFKALQEQIQRCINFDKHAFILNIGCGSSPLPDHLYQSGYHHIINNDISSVVINQMEQIREKKHYDQMVFQVMDVRAMSYADCSFDLVIDKSTIDSLMCSDNPITNVAHMLQHVYRVLVVNGIYLIVSYAQPSSRMQQLTRSHINFQIEVRPLKRINEQGHQLQHYLYLCRKIQMPVWSEERRKQFFKELRQLQLKQYPPL